MGVVLISREGNDDEWLAVMSRHFIHRYKHSHDKRRKFFLDLVSQGKAEATKLPDGWLITTNEDYRVSRKGNVIKCKDT